MRTVLVCVRSQRSACDVAALATRLGLAAAVRVATSQPEALLRLTEQPADVVLVDTDLLSSDSVTFTRQVLTRAPGASLVLFAADGRGAGAALAAGARGLIDGTERGGAALAAMALLLIEAAPAPAVVPAQRELVPGAGTPGVSVAGPGTDDEAGAGEPASGRGRPAEPAQGCGQPPAGTRLALSSAARPVPPPSVEPAAPPRPAGLQTPPPAPIGLTLTEREAQVLRAMANGKSNAEIGRELFVSEDTVKTHARRLFRKLGARDRAHAVATGFRAGLVV